MADVRPGDVVELPFVTSTSLDPVTALWFGRDLVWEIRTRPGQMVDAIATNPDQDEVILDRGIKLEVKEVLHNVDAGDGRDRIEQYVIAEVV